MYYPGPATDMSSINELYKMIVRDIPAVYSTYNCPVNDFEIRKAVNGYVIHCGNQEYVFNTVSDMTKWIHQHYKKKDK